MPDGNTPIIFTIGHSTRSFDELVSLLDARGVTALADIRTIPRSRRHPHFGKDSLARALPALGIAYHHFPGLGGLRTPRADSTNTGWRQAGFRGFADYMQTAAFARALAELVALATRTAPTLSCGVVAGPDASVVGGTPEHGGVRAPASGAAGPDPSVVGDTPEHDGVRASASGGGAPRVVIMCAEAVWWRCHRQLVADALVAAGLDVRHILSADDASRHELTRFARLIDGKITYPGLI